MSKEMIKLEHFEITNNSVHVYSSHTSYSNQVRLTFPKIDDVKNALKSAKTICKSQKISLKNQKKSIEYVKLLENEAIIEYQKYSELFDSYVEFWKGVDLSEGLDPKLASNLDSIYELRNTIDKFLYRTTILSKYVEQCNRILSVSYYLTKYPSYYTSGCTIYL